MKKTMRNVVLSVLMGTMLMVPTVAEGNNPNGTNKGSFPVNGYIGADNTNTDSGIPEGSDDWINVELPTATIFYTYDDETVVKSPEYKILNKSARGVEVYVNGFENSTETMDGLTLSIEDAANTSSKVSLVTDGTVHTHLPGTEKLFDIGAHVNQVPTAKSFEFSGSIVQGTPLKDYKNLNLELNFKSIAQ